MSLSFVRQRVLPGRKIFIAKVKNGGIMTAFNAAVGWFQYQTVGCLYRAGLSIQ